MGTAFEIELLNGLAGDPAVCVNFTQSGESLLFDAGSLESMSNRELLKVRVVAVSHTHVDHFIGFDRLLRVNVPHFRCIEVVGPAGIIANIKGKLAGYTWNLLEPDQVSFIVHEVSRSGHVRSCHLSNTWNFEERPVQNALHQKTQSDAQNTKSNNVAYAVIPLQTSRYVLKATVVDHGTDVLAFCLSMPPSVAVNKENLTDSGLTPGPWISELQRMAVNGIIEGQIDVNGSTHEAKQLADRFIQPKPGEQLVYVTDMVFSASNVKTLLALMANSAPDLLICEANYRHEHRERAHKKSHLTTRQAALLATILHAKRLQIFHISNIYGGDTETSIQESNQTLQEIAAASSDELWQIASREFISPP